jgi:hypothetical protein
MIPFGWLPGHWGLKGKTRERALAEYTLTGYDLEMKLAEIENTDSTQLELATIKIKRKYNRISDYDADVITAELTLTGDALTIAKVELDFQYKKITERQYKMSLATAKNEPYVAVVDSSYAPDQKLSGLEFEFDWNHLWIELLTANGYTGVTEELVVQRWFEDLCRAVVLEKAEEDTIPFNSRRASSRVAGPNGTEYS